jgi:hypothetical protein
MGPCKMHWRSGTGGIWHGAHTSQTMGHRIFLYMGQQLCFRIFYFIYTHLIRIRFALNVRVNAAIIKTSAIC